MHIPLDIFWCLKQIADKHNVHYNTWGEKAEIVHTRISEYVRMYKVEHKLQPAPRKEIKRAFTLEVSYALYMALKSILGESVMKKSMNECLNKETDPFKRIILMTIVKFGEGDKEFIAKSAEYMTMLFKVSESK